MPNAGASAQILLMGHGSRDLDGAREFVAVVDAVREAAAPATVEAGFLEFAGPVIGSIQQAFDRCAARPEPVLAVPVLLFLAGHGKADMPEQIEVARRRHPNLDVRFKPILGTDPTLLAIVEERILEAQADLPAIDAEQVAVLLVARGTTDAEANAEFFKIGRMLWERNHYGWVECAFSSLAWPDVPAGIDRCIRLGARRVVVAPYFMNTGVLVKRIDELARLAQVRYSETEIAVADPMGVHPALIGLILQRANDALGEGPAEPQRANKLWRYQQEVDSHEHEHHHHHDGDDGHQHEQQGTPTSEGALTGRR